MKASGQCLSKLLGLKNTIIKLILFTLAMAWNSVRPAMVRSIGRNLYSLISLVLLAVPGIAYADLCASVFSETISLGQTASALEFVGAAGSRYLFFQGRVWGAKPGTPGTWQDLGPGRVVRNALFKEGESSIFATLDPFVTVKMTTSVLKSVGTPSNTPLLNPLKNYQISVSQSVGYQNYWHSNLRLKSSIYSVKIGSHHLDIIVPEIQSFAGVADGILKTLMELPLSRISSIRTIRMNPSNFLHPMGTPENPHAPATARGNEIDIYEVSLNSYRQPTQEGLRVLRHEFGHTIATQAFGTSDPNQSYSRSKQADPYGVSAYGNTSLCEDFAEGIEVYLRTHGGELDPSTRSYFKNRFAFYDEIFNGRNPQSEALEKVMGAFGNSEIWVKFISPTKILALSLTYSVGVLIELD